MPHYLKISSINKNLLSYTILSILFLLTNGVYPGIGYIVLIYCLYKIIRNNTADNLKLIFFLLPNIRILDVLGFTSFINIIILIISIKYLIVTWNKIKNTKKIIMCTYFIFCLEFFHCLLNSTQFNTDLFNAINISINFMVCICIINDVWTKKDIKEMSLSLSFGVIISTLIFIMCNPDTINQIFNSRYRLSAYGNDANYLSFYILISIAGLLIHSYYNTLNVKETVSVILNVGIGLLTSSKMCILGMLIIFTIYIICILSKKNLKKLLGILIKVIPIVLILIFYLKDQLEYLIEKFFERFQENYSSTVLDNLTSGRSELFSKYMSLMNNDIISLVFGRGVNYYTYYQQYGIELMAHNTYLDFILSWGILGTFVFIIIFILNIYHSISLKNRLINFLPLIIFMIMLMSLSCMSADMFWYLLALVIIPLSRNQIIKGEE